MKSISDSAWARHLDTVDTFMKDEFLYFPLKDDLVNQFWFEARNV